MTKVRIGILGTGTIAAKLTTAMKQSPYVTLTAVGSRSKASADSFAARHGIPSAHGSYEELLHDPQVDLIYITTPHPLHYPLAKRALLCGKHVLCEKPMTVNAAQAEALFALARERELFLSEAMWTRFLPAVTVVKELLSAGTIGEVRAMTGSMAFPALAIPRLCEAALGGGMLLDCGTYLLTTASLLFGEDVKGITTDAVLSEEGIDLRSTTVLRYHDGKTASLFLAMDALGEDRVVICGDKGYLSFAPPYNWQSIVLHRQGVEPQEIPLPPQTALGYEYMIDAIGRAILDSKRFCDETSEEKTLSVLRLMDRIRAMWGMRYPEEIEAL